MATDLFCDAPAVSSRPRWRNTNTRTSVAMIVLTHDITYTIQLRMRHCIDGKTGDVDIANVSEINLVHPL